MDVERDGKYELVPVRVKHSDFAYIPGLVDRTGYAGAVLTGMTRKCIDITIKAVEHAEV